MNSPTPGPATSKPPIFANTMLFIDPGMTGRPQLIKQLRDHGMPRLCTSPRDARIILVSLRTNSGRQFVRDWGTDTSKIVLRSAWVQECISQGRALMENDGWGGFVAEDDGLPIEDEGDDDDMALQPFSTQPTPSRTQDSALACSMRGTSYPMSSGTMPTPRAQPNDSYTQSQPKVVPIPPSRKTRKHNHQQTLVNGTHPAQGTASIPNPDAQSFHDLPGSPNPNNLHLSQHPGSHNNSLPPSQPNSIPPTPTHNIYQPMPPVNGMAQPSQQAQTNPLLHPHSVVHVPNTPLVYSQMPPASQQTQMSGNSSYLPQSGPFSPMPGPQAPLPFIPPVSGQYPPVQDPYARHHYNGIVNPFHTPMPQYGYPYNGAYPPMALPADAKMTPPQSPSPCQLQESSEEEQPIRKPRRKGKRRIKCEEDTSGLDEEPIAHEVPEPPSQSQRPLKKGDGSKFFIAESGEPLHFFFQVEGMPNRSGVVKETKSRGGVIVADVGKADFAVLRAGSKEFKTAFAQCKHGGTPAVKIDFILDCLDEGKVLDWHDYRFDEDLDPSQVKRRGRKAPTPAKRASRPIAKERKTAVKRMIEEEMSIRDTGDKRPKLEPSETEDQSDEPPQKKQKGRSKAELIDTDPTPSQSSSLQSEAASPYYRPSPPPPPAHTRKPFTGGKYYYTKEDMDCAAEYLQVLLERDAKMPTLAIAAKLSKKMPYHSTNSWTTRMQKLNLDGMREKIERRIRLHGNPFGKDGVQQHQQHQQPSDTPGSTLSRKAERKAAEDFDCIVNFFTSGGGDEGEDEEVWERLEKKHSCQSAASWPEFYSNNKPAIDDAIKEFVEQKGGQMN